MHIIATNLQIGLNENILNIQQNTVFDLIIRVKKSSVQCLYFASGAQNSLHKASKVTYTPSNANRKFYLHKAVIRFK